MYNFILFCKSYVGDFELMKVLVDSYLRFNKDSIPFYISIPRSDFSLFQKYFCDKKVFLLADEEITNGLVREIINGFDPGYINQQIVKLTFWKKGLAKNYFCIDSDSYFIRDFFYNDFMFNKDVPYAVLSEDKELCVDPIYYKTYWASRLDSLNKIKQRIGLTEKRLLTCHNNTTLSSKVLESFEKEFMLANNLSYLDILKISPFEFSWYNFWLQKSKIIPIIPIEPLFKMFHLREHYVNYYKNNITEADIARAYIGICLNSNWAKQKEKKTMFNYKQIYQKIGVMGKLKAIVKNKFPAIYRILKRIYHFLLNPNNSSNIEVIAELKAQEDYEQFLERTIYYRNIPLMKKAFNSEYFVHNGPFVGMKYIQQSTGSALLPKILGSYEEPIHKWIEQIISNPEKYRIILDIGCAEGYYAVGFALRMPNTEIIAYDVNDRAREKLNKMIEINKIKNIIVKDECSFDELNLKSKKGTLVFCDIEGAEKMLLDPIKVSNLLTVDILVESHDCSEPGVTDVLISRFFKTHAIEIVVDYPSRIKHYTVPNQISMEDYNELINEHRAEAMRYLFIKSLV